MKNKPTQLTAFLPCRKGSERVVNKNIRPFGAPDNSLIKIKLRQLMGAKLIDKIVVSTDDPEILELSSGSEFKAEPRLDIVQRPGELARSATSTDDLINHVADLIPGGDILWTHVTSPFIDAALYDEIITAYRLGAKQGHDSLMTVTPLRNFLWSKEGPVNYDPAIEKWPRTQTLKPMHIVNSGAFIAPAHIYKSQNNRIGKNPVLHALDRIQELDVDWMEDFELCERIWIAQQS